MSENNPKDWWAPLRVGLFTDKKHREKMSPAIWLYGYLHLYADRQTGRLSRNCQTIALEIGASVKTVQRWMRLLERKKYIQLRRLPHGFSIQIEKFRPISKKNRTDSSVQSGEERPDTFGIVTGQSCNSDRTIIDSPDKNVVHGSITELRAKETRTDKNEGLKERFKESNKEREAHSQDKSSKKPPANPDVKVAVDHFYDEFVRIHNIKPQVNGSACKTFQRLLSTRSIEQVNTLTTGYLSLADAKLRDKGYPIEWMPNHINRLMMAEKKPDEGLVY
ncbi:MAG: helix-turn-helix domain-containing protein [Nitrospinaceae bacterium]|nr:helix-turn-helix domain-containing protein [Nitrospinaceae bacterium]